MGLQDKAKSRHVVNIGVQRGFWTWFQELTMLIAVLDMMLPALTLPQVDLITHSKQKCSCFNQPPAVTHLSH